MMIGMLCVLLATAGATSRGDTIRLEVGSAEVDGRIYEPHAARVRVRVGPGEGRLSAEWTNELTLGDSAGRRVMRWVTRGRRFAPAGDTVTWEILQTYDARTLAPYGYASTSSTGAFTRLAIDGRRVTGTRRAARDSAVRQVNLTLDRPGFIASASDLVPLAAGLREGAVMTAPFWSPAMTRSELRVFSVAARVPVTVEGTEVRAWKVEERRYADRALLATWYLTEASPYMVYGEVPLPDGGMQRMTEVEIPLQAAALRTQAAPNVPRDSAASGALYAELARMDSLLFDAAFVSCDAGKALALFTGDAEFYHDQTGFESGEKLRETFRRLTASCPRDRAITRELVAGSVQVYPMKGYGAVQMGVHRFVQRDPPSATIARFVHLWRQETGGWRLARVLSFDHRRESER